MPGEPVLELETELILRKGTEDDDSGTGASFEPEASFEPPSQVAFEPRSALGHRKEIQDSDMMRYHDIHLPKCKGCSRRWPYPRQVAFLCDIPQDMRGGMRERSLSFFEPVSKEMIVLYQTCDRHTGMPHLGEEIFSRIKLTHSLETKCGLKSLSRCQKGNVDLHRLVTEFDYNGKTGDVTHCAEFFDGEKEADFRYARLLTLNSWYVILMKNILQIILEIFSLAAGVMLLGQLCAKDAGFQKVKFVLSTRYWFASWYGGFFLIAVLLSARAAHWEWKASSSPMVGDIVTKCHLVDRSVAYVALTLFILLGVDKLIKDIVKIIHPWKSVQPYAAVKMEGARVHVVGYKSRPLFNVENSSGQYSVLLVLSTTRLLLFIYNASIIIAIGYHNRYWDNFPFKLLERLRNPSPDDIPIQGTLRISICVSTISAALSLYKVRKLRQQRLLLKEELVHILDAAEKDGDMSKKGPASKLLALHFQQEYTQGAFHKVSASKFSPDHDSKCSVCGRAHPMDIPEGKDA